MVRTCESSRAACTSKCAPRFRPSAAPDKNSCAALIIEDRMAIGCACGGEALEMVLHAFVQQLVLGQQIRKRRNSRAVRQMAQNDQVRDFDESGFLGQFLDRNAAIAQNAVFAVNESDLAVAGAGVARSRHPA